MTLSATPPQADKLAQIVDSTTGFLTALLEQMDWAGDEIRLAISRHPNAADTLWHSNSLLVPTHERMATELVFRAHCRELLDRVASGADTRPGTAAEVICVCRDASVVAPLNSPTLRSEQVTTVALACCVSVRASCVVSHPRGPRWQARAAPSQRAG